MAKNSSHITRQQLFIPPLFLTARQWRSCSAAAGWQSSKFADKFQHMTKEGKTHLVCTATHVGSIYSGRGSDTTVIIFVNGLNRDVAIRASQVRNLLKCPSLPLCASFASSSARLRLLKAPVLILDKTARQVITVWRVLMTTCLVVVLVRHILHVANRFSFSIIIIITRWDWDGEGGNGDWKWRCRKAQEDLWYGWPLSGEECHQMVTARLHMS